MDTMPDMGTPITRGEHDEFVRRMEAENSRLAARISILENSSSKIGELNVSIERLMLKLDVMESKLSSMTQDVDEIKDRDGDMWRKLVSYAATAVVGLAVGAIWNTIIGM